MGTRRIVLAVLAVVVVLGLVFLWHAYGAFVRGTPLTSLGLAFFTQPDRFANYAREGTWGRGLTLRQLAGTEEASTLARLALPWSELLPTDKASHAGYLDFYETQLGPLRARPRASICCSPPDSIAARCVERSARIGNRP